MYLEAVVLWKVLIPPGMWWSVVVLLEGELDRLEGDPLRRSSCLPLSSTAPVLSEDFVSLWARCRNSQVLW